MHQLDLSVEADAGESPKTALAVSLDSHRDAHAEQLFAGKRLNIRKKTVLMRKVKAIKVRILN